VLVNIEDRSQKQLFKVPNKIRELLPSVEDVARSKWAVLQGSVIGFLIGILPGAGSTVASFVSYIVANRTSKYPEEFGKGSIEGRPPPTRRTAAAKMRRMALVSFQLSTNSVMPSCAGMATSSTINQTKARAPNPADDQAARRARCALLRRDAAGSRTSQALWKTMPKKS
jgi:TctA family transporter